MSETRAVKFIESCGGCDFYSYEQESYWCNKIGKKLLDNYPQIPPICPLPKWPSVSMDEFNRWRYEFLNAAIEKGGMSFTTVLAMMFKSIGVEVIDGPK